VAPHSQKWPWIVDHCPKYSGKWESGCTGYNHSEWTYYRNQSSIFKPKCPPQTTVSAFNFGMLCTDRDCCREQLVFCLHTGHAYLRHIYLLDGDDPAVCVSCQERLAVEHILRHVHCAEYIPEYIHICYNYLTVATERTAGYRFSRVNYSFHTKGWYLYIWSSCNESCRNVFTWSFIAVLIIQPSFWLCPLIMTLNHQGFKFHLIKPLIYLCPVIIQYVFVCLHWTCFYTKRF
jgi:ABC-type sugar transport system permease subunit